MLGISRWTGEGRSYRTVQRFFNISFDWTKVQWSLIQKFFLNTSDTIVLAGDETTVTKSGKKTFSLDRFYSSLFGKPVPGLSFFVFSYFMAPIPGAQTQDLGAIHEKYFIPPTCPGSVQLSLVFSSIEASLYLAYLP